MRRFSRILALLLATVAVALLTPTSSAKAITNGFVDENNTYSNAGIFVVQRHSDGRLFGLCSGTLIAPTVFLTAGHCTEAFLVRIAPRGFTAFVSFDNPIPLGSLTDLKKTNLTPVTEVITNPNFSQRQDDPGDIGVLILAAGSTSGITPATLPTLGLLDQLAAKNGLRDAVFTVVGYGLQDREEGGGPPVFTSVNPVPRMYAFSSFLALHQAFLRLSQNEATGDGGACAGDSGGPSFLDVGGQRILVAIAVQADPPCKAINDDYRLDIASAREFLGQFVILP